VVNMPAADKCAGFYMGPDGYIWGRSPLERQPPAAGPRPLVIEKQWYSFLLWGRLASDPTLTNTHFERILAARFPGVPAATLFAASNAASRIIPTITSFFWGDIDLKWFPAIQTLMIHYLVTREPLGLSSQSALPGRDHSQV
jgi:hypothetical protein